MATSSSALYRGGPEGGEPVKGITVDESVCKDIVRFLLDPAHSTLDPASRPFYSADRLVDFAQHGGTSIAGVLVRAHEANADNVDSILRVCDSLLILLRAPSVVCNLFGFTWTPEITKVAQVDSAEQLFRDYVDSATYAVEFDWSFRRASSTTKNSGRRKSSKGGARRVELTFAHGDQGVQDLLLAHLCESMTLGLADTPFEYAELCTTTTGPEDPVKLVAVRNYLPWRFWSLDRSPTHLVPLFHLWILSTLITAVSLFMIPLSHFFFRRSCLNIDLDVDTDAYSPLREPRAAARTAVPASASRPRSDNSRTTNIPAPAPDAVADPASSGTAWEHLYDTTDMDKFDAACEARNKESLRKTAEVREARRARRAERHRMTAALVAMGNEFGAFL
ncbi:hypothetical protein JCM10207_000380 [Rhodosporidiobolus poonsookiae]